MFSSRMNVKPQLKNLRRNPNHEEIKIILKEGVDKGGCKGGGYVYEISRPRKYFKYQ